MKSTTLTEGYKLVIKTANNTTLHLYYDSANAFVRAQTLSSEKALSIFLPVQTKSTMTHRYQLL
jgi:hypothetical protein